MIKVFLLFLMALIFLLLHSCKESSNDTLFKLIPPEHSGIYFSNTIYENDTINILKLEYVYNGGGVAVGDFNNDGLSDIFFTGNQVSNRLYLNKGNLKFEDITIKAGLDDTTKWRSGVALVDINQDGWLDIYVCATIKEDSSLRANMLFVNQGLDENGVPTFIDQAAQYGVNFMGHSQSAAFLDYDRDGDLDLYILVNTQSGKVPVSFRGKITDGSAITNDRLYRNNGDGTFSDVTKAAGILIEGYGLGIAIADINNDGWPDIYIGNDYMTNDVLYINNQDGTFTNQITQFVKHQSQFSMGNDVADVNNDGLPDIVTLDMLPEGNLRRKTVIVGGSYTSYINNEKYGYEHQYVRNMLQLNNGDGTFSEIGQLAGIYQTEWSWSPLFADFDNDGYRDLIITNGFPKDVTDRDFGLYRSSQAGRVSNAVMLLDSIPVVKVSNYAYRNNKDLTFQDVTSLWGFERPSFSNGAAFADLDNDGDLDYIINNINDVAFLYENTLNTRPTSKSNYLRIKLQGIKGNMQGLGTKITLYYGNGRMQYHDHSVYRGYLSTVENSIHFGLGEFSKVDSIKIIWPDNKLQILNNIQTNQVLVVNQLDAQQLFPNAIAAIYELMLLAEGSQKKNILFKHSEEDKIDFNIQKTLPHKYSQSGPGISVGDINGDEREDIYISGSANNKGTFFIQNANGTFERRDHVVNHHLEREELGTLLFDADNDGDLDLYVVGGSFEWPQGDSHYQDRLYLNDGKGNYKEAENAIPLIVSSGSCVRAADYDGDGDLDLFIGGRVLPWKYPYAPESYILDNDKGKFTDVTDKVCPNLKKIGMVSDALWTDFDNDGMIDLMLAGELMPLTFFKNIGSTFIDVTNTSNLSSYKGWWNSLTAGDFDRDGDTDYIAGNLGLNNYYHASQERPVIVYAKDFDGNGSVDPIIACYFKMEDGSMKICPVHFWDELNALSPKFRRKFSRYKQYGKATIEELLSPEDLEGALVLEGNYSSSSYIENLGNGQFKIHPLPVQAQFAPIFGMVADDINKDGNLDVLMVGNDYGNEVFSGRLDAFNGVLLCGNGKGEFTAKTNSKSGFSVAGDAKALVKMYDAKNNVIYVATQNRDSVKVFSRESTGKMIRAQPADCRIDLIYKDGRKQKVELYYGSGYLSQSSRNIALPYNVKELIIYDYQNKQRKISLIDEITEK